MKRGKGALYLSSSVEYYTNDENVAAQATSELNVTREYLRLKVEQVDYKLKWTTAPLTGEIQSGDLIVVKLRVTGQKARHLMLEDPIPSGAEQLEAVGNLNLNSADASWSDWYSSREFRDRRTLFFLDHFDGDVTFQYAMRVQIPGAFVVAARACGVDVSTGDSCEHQYSTVFVHRPALATDETDPWPFVFVQSFAFKFPGTSAGYAHPERRRRGAKGRFTASTLRLASSDYFRVVYPQSPQTKQADYLLNILETSRTELLRRSRSSPAWNVVKRFIRVERESKVWKRPADRRYSVGGGYSH